MRRRMVRGALIVAAVVYGAVGLTTGNSSAQVPLPPGVTLPPGFTVPTFPIPTTTPPPTMPPPTTSTTSPPPTMPPPSPTTTTPPPTMPPTSLPSTPSFDDVRQEIFDRAVDIAERFGDDVAAVVNELLQDL